MTVPAIHDVRIIGSRLTIRAEQCSIEVVGSDNLIRFNGDRNIIKHDGGHSNIFDGQIVENQELRDPDVEIEWTANPDQVLFARDAIEKLKTSLGRRV